MSSIGFPFLQSVIAVKRRIAMLPTDVDELVRQTLDGIQSKASIPRDPTFRLERPREILRSLLPTLDGARPIRVEVDVHANRGWRSPLRR
jgi:hypothetical protein